MKNVLVFFLLTGMLTPAAFGQTDSEEIKKSFARYFHTLEQKDNAKTLDYIYPKLFDHYPKDRILLAMDKMKADTTSSVTMENAAVTNVSETLQVDGIKYAVVNYTIKMTMTFIATEDEANPADLTYEMLKEEYGDQNIVYDRENSKIEVNVANEVYAINDPAYSGWKFLEKKENMKPVLEQLLPKKVMSKL